MSTSSITSVVSSITSSASSYSKSSSSSTASTSTGSTSSSFTYELYTQKVINPVKATLDTATHLGYIDKNKIAVEVQGTITRQDKTNYFTFTFRKGDSLKLDTNINKGVRIQITDSSGYHILADNGGHNATLKKAFEALKNGTLDLKNGNYAIKITYDDSAYKNKTLNYDLTLSSGTSYKNKYKTFAQATTVYNTLLEGGDIGNVYSQTATAATLMTALSDGTDINLFDYMS